jgi:thymidylate kinase
MKLITLSGVDGSGKSTQLTLLKEKLEQEGQRVFYFHAVEFSLANRLARRLKGHKNFTPGSEKATTQASWFSLQLRKVFLFIDIIRFRSLKKKLERQNYGYLISDRYFYDSVVNILYLDKKSNASLPWIEKHIPKPDYAFYMDIHPKDILKRERVPEQGMIYLKDKIEIFKRKIASWSIRNIDANQAKENVQASIYQEISKESA